MEKVTRTDAEWQESLSKLAYMVTRRHATERAFSHPGFPSGPGTYACVCCGEPLFDQSAKYDSGSGWPSFWAPVKDGALEESVDYKIGAPRTEIHCARCDAHLGHVFPDGPQPTGLRYCMNGVALDFVPSDAD